MKIAVGIVDLFAGGGLQRDCIEICAVLRGRGHDVALYCAQAEARLINEHRARALPVRSLTNHGRDVAFGRSFVAASRGDCDIRVGFNKLPGLDVLYCADRCLASRPTGAWITLLPRYRARRTLEAGCFGPEAETVALMLSRAAVDEYRSAWATPEHRLRILPPTIARSRARPRLPHDNTRARLRSALGIVDSEIAWLFVGTQPHTKGLDRAIEALDAVPHARLLVVGADAERVRVKALLSRARRQSLAERVHWLGHREDMPELMAAADVLVHPARFDMTGQVILEALTMGLPVIATAACGFAEHVLGANAGIVLPEPFSPRALQAAIAQASSEGARRAWSRSALDYCAKHDFTRGHEIAADIIEEVALAVQNRLSRSD